MRLSTACLLALITAACNTTPQPAAVPPPEYPVIVSIVSRHQTIIIRESPDGPVYTAKNADGQTLFQNLNLESLQAQHPDIYNQLKGYRAPDLGRWDASINGRMMR